MARSLGGSRKTDHEHLEIDRRVDARASALGGIRVGRAADLAHTRREPDGIERLIELAIEGAGGRLWQAAGLDPELLLGLGGGLAGLEHAAGEFKQTGRRFSTGC
ncbi:MAG: hypothetical protein R2845_17115 [Thermomicrobiales bacterium]